MPPLASIMSTYPTFQNRMEPSEPPEANNPSCTGCHDTALASFLWPRNTWTSSLRFRKSNSFSKWSRDAVTNQFPLSFHFRSITVDLWACLKKSVPKLNDLPAKRIGFGTYKVANAWPLFGSHILIGCWLSLLPDTINAFWGCQWTHLTSAPWPSKNKLC